MYAKCNKRKQKKKQCDNLSDEQSLVKKKKVHNYGFPFPPNCYDFWLNRSKSELEKKKIHHLPIRIASLKI